MTAKKAINIGQILVNGPVVILVVGYFLIGTRVMEAMDLPIWMFFAFLAAVIGVSWIYWSIVAPRWLVWAYQKVTDKKELKERAIAGKLIWEEENFFSKTMVLTRKDKAIIAQAEQEIENGVTNEELLETSLVLYINPLNFWGTFAFYTGFGILSIACIIIGISPFDKLMVGLGLVLSALFIPIWFMKVPMMENKEAFLTIVKRYFSKEKQLEINETGISVRSVRTGLIEWKSLHRYEIIPTSFGRVEKLNISYWNEPENLKIAEIPFEYFSTDEVTLRKILDYHLRIEN